MNLTMSMTILALLFFQIAPVSAATIKEIEGWAVQHSNQLSAEEMEQKALGAEKETRGKWANPQLMGQVGTLSSGGIKGATVEVSFTQAIPISNKYSLRKEVATLALSRQSEQKEYFENWIKHQALKQAWIVKMKHELYLHGVERAQRLSLIKKYVMTHPRVSVKQQVELSLIEASMLQMEKMQDQRKLELDQAMNDLEFWIGKKMKTEEIKLEVPSVDQVKLPVSDKNFKNIDLIFAKNQLESTRTDLSLIKKERLPDLFLGGGYRVENVVPANHFSYGIIGLNIPLWDTGFNRVETAKAREARDLKLFEETNRRTNLKLEKQKQQVLYQYEQLKRFQFKNVHKQEDEIHNAERGFKQGFLDVVTFLQAEIQTHEVIDQIFISWMDYLDAMSTLQLLRGESFQWTK
jgi:hypothetical protein